MGPLSNLVIPEPKIRIHTSCRHQWLSILFYREINESTYSSFVKWSFPSLSSLENTNNKKCSLFIRVPEGMLYKWLHFEIFPFNTWISSNFLICAPLPQASHFEWGIQIGIPLGFDEDVLGFEQVYDEIRLIARNVVVSGNIVDLEINRKAVMA